MSENVRMKGTRLSPKAPSAPMQVLLLATPSRRRPCCGLMAKRMPEGGRHDLQAESESRAINMVYGAAAAVHAYDSLSVRPESR